MMDPEDEAHMIERVRIERARSRDETEAYLLGQYTPVEQALDTVTQRQNIWFEMVDLVLTIADSDEMTDELYGRAQYLAQKLRSL